MKRTTSITVNTELLELAQKSGLVLSHFVEEALKNYLNYNDEILKSIDDLEKADKELAVKSVEIAIIKKKREELQEELQKEKEKKDKEAGRWREI